MGSKSHKLIAVYKDKQYLIFELDDGKTVKYDFATNKAIGKKGKYVQDLRSQLAGVSISDIIDLCTDHNYAEFLRWVKRQGSYWGNNIYNIGTILDNVSRWSKFEQFFSAGIYNIDPHFRYTIGDIPKGLRTICKNNNVPLDDKLYSFYQANPNGYYVALTKEYISLQINDVKDALYTYTSRPKPGERYMWEEISYFNILTSEYGYNATALMDYLDYLYTYEALNNVSNTIRELFDYVKMMKEISNKFDKYPRHFLTTHQIAARNYNRLKKKFKEEDFKQRIDTSLEDKIGDYVFIYPKSTQEIKDEAVAQNNCVASYIDRVLEGSCHIMFMRKKSDPEESLVTLEIRNNIIVQSRRRFNYPTTAKDNLAIEKWNERHHIREMAA